VNTAELSRLTAPVAYQDVRLRLNTVRAAFGIALAILAITGMIDGSESGPWLLGCAVIILGDGIWRRTHGASALFPLAVDATLMAVILSLRGDPRSVSAVVFLYVLAGSLLLLRIPLAAALVTYALLLGIPVVALSPLTDPPAGGTRESLFTAVVMVSFALIVATLLYGAVRALHAATLRHRDAIASERRAVELKDEFVSMVSHEFRTPLTSVAGFAEMLRSNWLDLQPQEIEEFLVIMRREAHHLSDLVEDILTIPRLEAGRLRLRPEEFDLSAEVHGIARLVFADTGKDVNTAIPGGVMVLADRGRTGQILRNLLDNARKYGGDAVQIEGEAGTDVYTVSVSDNGPGIDQEDWERVFEHFEQGSKGDSRSDQGVGLGLPIARKLARAMGGDVWYVPRFPTGASFKFSLRLSRIIHNATMQPVAIDTQTFAVRLNDTNDPVDRGTPEVARRGTAPG
jgi:signal transduction histidine kinase